MLTQEPDFTPGMSESGILSRVNRFVHENAFYRDRGFVLTEDERFLGTVGVNSKHVGEMITFIEEEFGVDVSNCEISEDNLGTLRAVARFVTSKQPYAVG